MIEVKYRREKEMGVKRGIERVKLSGEDEHARIMDDRCCDFRRSKRTLRERREREIVGDGGKDVEEGRKSR